MVKTNTTYPNISKAYRAPSAPAKKITQNSLERVVLKKIAEDSTDYGLYKDFCDLISQNIREAWKINADIKEENSKNEDPYSTFFKNTFSDKYPADPFYISKIYDAPKKHEKKCSEQPDMSDRMEDSCDGYHINFNNEI
jgi:hypothetical protein